jgi:predicted lipoprotein with Yx(FWY)xxD motif
MMLHGNRAILAIAILPVLAVGLAACGGSSSDSSDTGSAAGDGMTVATRSIAGTDQVLVDSTGHALYTNDMDTMSKVACSGECLTEWVPLAAPEQGGPSSSDSALQAKLGTVQRPDGTTQVTFAGLPLYTFVEDSSGQVTGDGFSDRFGGTRFVWTAATAGGSSGGSAAPTTQGSSGGYQY